MTSPIVYILAVIGGLLALWFLFAAWLAYRHGKTRTTRGPDLTAYAEVSGERMRGIHVSQVAKTQELRASAMQVTIGDLVRDEALVEFAADGIATRRRAMKSRAAVDPRPTPHPTFLLKRDVDAGFYFDLLAPDGSTI